MAYFGYPAAHEDDAERAVRAGLDLIAAVANLEGKTKIEVRVGIATGLVIVGDLIGEHAAKERAVTGETPNPLGSVDRCIAKSSPSFCKIKYRRVAVEGSNGVSNER